jgi:hypothetical protein
MPSRGAKSKLWRPRLSTRAGLRRGIPLLFLGAVPAMLAFSCSDSGRVPEPPAQSASTSSQKAALATSPETGCTSATFAGHQYWFCSAKRSWATARANCEASGSNLVRIDSSAENEFVHSNIGGESWIGANDLVAEGVWRWTFGNSQFWSGNQNGTPTSALFNRWDSSQPNNLGNEDCAQMQPDGEWLDDACNDTERYVCEAGPDECPNDPAKVEPGVCGCGATDVDSDSDGTFNCHDQCPNDPKKIGPGDCGCADAPKPTGTPCSDGLCAANTTCNGSGICGNPSACTPPDSDCESAVFENTYYWICDNDRTFANARQRCQAQGMDLAAAEKALEDDFITGKISEDSFLGGSDQAVEGTWTWLSTAQTFWTGGASGAPPPGVYAHWNSGQPAEVSSGAKDCLLKESNGAGKWETQECDDQEAFVCEAPRRLRPTTPCIRPLGGSGGFEALFGYENRLGRKDIPVGPDNFFTTAPAGRGQPRVFFPGRVEGAFAVQFSGGTISWTLAGATVTASASSPVCPPESCGSCGQARTCLGNSCVNVCGDGQCGLLEDCASCPSDCGCPQGEVCSSDGSCGTPKRCGLDWECGSGVSFGVQVDCGQCPAGKTCVFHACQ